MTFINDLQAGAGPRRCAARAAGGRPHAPCPILWLQRRDNQIGHVSVTIKPVLGGPRQPIDSGTIELKGGSLSSAGPSPTPPRLWPAALGISRKISMISLLWHFRASSAARSRGRFRERIARAPSVRPNGGALQLRVRGMSLCQAVGGQNVCLHFALLLTPQTSVCRCPPHVPRLKRRFDLLTP